MIVRYGLGEVARPTAVTIGNFDGVHIGHRAILREVVQAGREQGWIPTAMTFDPHPLRLVAPERAPRLLTTPEERARLMAAGGIEQLLVAPFTPEFSRLSPEQFAAEVLAARLEARAVLVGDNFRFGRGGAGDVALLAALGRKYGFQTRVVPRLQLRGRPVSSSEVRRLIEAGRVGVAGRLLARCYAIDGKIVSGRGVGSRQTVPTLNLATSAEVIPATGVYVTRTADSSGDRRWPSVTNVGYRPTFGPSELTIETFLLAPLDGPDPERVRLEFLHRLRDERKFPGPAELKAQILRDAGRARALFGRLRRAGLPD